MKKQKGFNLLELLIVIAILMVLAAMAVPSIMSTIRAGQQAAAIENLKSLAAAQAKYYSNHSMYPGSTYSLGDVDSANNNQPYADSKWLFTAFTRGVNGYKLTELISDVHSFGIQMIATPVGSNSGFCTTQLGAIHRIPPTVGNVGAVGDCLSYPIYQAN